MSTTATETESATATTVTGTVANGGKDIETTTPPTTTKVYGPAGTTPGGRWHRRVRTAIDRNPCCALACCIFCCDISTCIIMCVPLKDEFVYLDPIKKVLINEKGHQVPPGNEDRDVTEEEFLALQEKYAPPAKEMSRE